MKNKTLWWHMGGGRSGVAQFSGRNSVAIWALPSSCPSATAAAHGLKSSVPPLAQCPGLALDVAGQGPPFLGKGLGIIRRGFQMPGFMYLLLTG